MISLHQNEESLVSILPSDNKSRIGSRSKCIKIRDFSRQGVDPLYVIPYSLNKSSVPADPTFTENILTDLTTLSGMYAPLSALTILYIGRCLSDDVQRWVLQFKDRSVGWIDDLVSRVQFHVERYRRVIDVVDSTVETLELDRVNRDNASL